MSMDDLISRQVAIEAIEEYGDRLQMLNWKENPSVPYKAYALNWCVNTIRDLPSAQPERKTGRWIIRENPDWNPFGNTIRFFYICSECGCWGSEYRFCPNCGAKMEADNGQADH